MRSALHFCAIACLFGRVVSADTFNGLPDNETITYGKYYAVVGGVIQNNQRTDNTLWMLNDYAFYGPPTGTWSILGDNPIIASIAMTLKSGSTVVYDNTGIPTGTVPTGYWDSSQVPGSQFVGYSMSNNYDRTFAGYFHLDLDLTIDSLTGYFLVPQSLAPNFFNLAGNFDPSDPHLQYHINIFSEDAGLVPTNTGSFAGDVFSSDNTAGAFFSSPTGYVRKVPGWTADIYRMEYKLSAPITLPAGDYYFSHDATVGEPSGGPSVVPLPGTAISGLVLFGFLLVRRVRSRIA